MSRRLTELESNQKGKVKSINGGIGAQNKLEAMGLRTGKIIKKKSAQVFRGPITIEIDGRQLAIGHGMAKKIEVTTDLEE